MLSLDRNAKILTATLEYMACKPKVKMAIGSNPAVDSLVAVHNSSPGRPESCEGNLVAEGG